MKVNTHGVSHYGNRTEISSGAGPQIKIEVEDLGETSTASYIVIRVSRGTVRVLADGSIAVSP